MTAEEARWRRQDDARTLARAEEIKADSERMSNARQGAREILDDEAARLKGLSRVASQRQGIPHNTRSGEKQSSGFVAADRYTSPAKVNIPFPYF